MQSHPQSDTILPDLRIRPSKRGSGQPPLHTARSLQIYRFEMSFPPPIQSHQIQHTSATKLPYRLHNYLSSGSGRTEEELDGSLPECHARGSRAPSTRFRPGYRPGRCGSRCTPSWCRLKGGAAADVGNGRRRKALSRGERRVRRRLSLRCSA